MKDLAKNLYYSQYALKSLFSVTNKLQLRGDQYLNDMTLRQTLAIPAIIHAPEGNVSISSIARSLGTTKQSAKQIVDAMEKKNYVEVVPSETDKRAVNIEITPEGKDAFDVCSARNDIFLADIFQDFSTEELEILCTLLKKLYRFDGAEQTDSGEFAKFDDADSVLKFHQNFVRRKTKTYENKE